MSLLLGIAGLGALGYSVASGIYDRYKQNKNNTKSENFSREQLDESIRQYNNDYAEAVRQYNKNFAFNQSEALRSQQNFESEVARDQYNLEHQYQTAVSDASKAGLNPLALSGLGSSAFGSATSMSAPSSTVSASPSVSGSYSPQKVGSNSSLDMSLISDILDKKFQSSENEKDRDTSKEIASMQEQTKQDEALMSFLTATEANSIRRDELTEQIRKNQSNESIARAVASETVRNNLMLEELKRAGIENDKARLALEQAKQDDTYQIALRQLEQQKAALENAKNQADKDRRMNYITRIFGTLLDAVSRIAGGMLKK